MKPYYKAIISSVVIILFFTVLFNFYGYNNTWEVWNIKTMTPHFADTRNITHGAVPYSQGLDPMIENPGDPWQRRLNYPRIWHTLYSLGINKSHTTFMGLTIIFSFLVGVCLIIPNVDNKTLVLVFAAVLSPATLLGVERANIDLLMFFLASLSIFAAQRSNIFSGLIILFAFILKFFPIFGWAIFLKTGKSKFILSTIISLSFVGFYLFISYSDMLLIWEGVPRSIHTSYGINVVWMALSKLNLTLGVFVKVFSYLVIILIIIFAFLDPLQNKYLSEKPSNTLNIDAFRVGAAIYIGTFFLGNNWDYRLVFLIFTLPQLFLWTKLSTSISSISTVAIISITFSHWHSIIAKLISYIPNGKYFIFILEELSNWIIFSSLVYLFIWSLPTWGKEFIRKPPYKNIIN